MSLGTTLEQTKKGFAVGCLHCGETGGVTLSLDDLDTFHCGGCDNDFCLDDVRRFLAQWGRVVKWIEMAPPAE